MMVTGHKRLLVATLSVVVFGFTWSAAAQTSATIAGTVKDAQGGTIPGASMTLISESKGTTFETQSTANGDFIFSNVPGDTYTIRVALAGFKTAERKGVPASPGDRVTVGFLTLEVGAVAETVVVSAEATIIQTQTGEQSSTVPKESIENLPMTGRNYSSFAVLAPGVQLLPDGTGRVVRLDGARSNNMLDGVNSVNTGGNQQGINLNSDSIAEVKVLTNAYQAEYGRSTGITIVGVTKSGSNQFRGSVFDLERNSDWNSNSWENVRNGRAKPVSKQKDWGYTIGGPVGRAGGSNKLFFFYSEQFSPRTSGGAVNQFRVPTLLERQGDFSQSTDNTGARFNLIRDSTTGLPCTTADTRGCFQDGGVLGRIPQNRLYGLGLNILKTYPVPNAQGLNYNLETVAPNVDSNTFQHLIRIDYQASSKLRLSAKYAGENRTVQTNPGSIPGFNDQNFALPTTLVPSATATYVINPTTLLEGSWGVTRGNQVGNVPVSPVTNRCDVGLCNFPLLYPNAGLVPAGSYQDQALTASGTPFYSNGQVMMAPTYIWGSRIGNPPPNNQYPPFLAWQYTDDVALSLTKLVGRHSVKGGFQWQHSLKVQNLGFGGAAFPFQGEVNFSNDSNNPLDTGFGFSNAALGVFSAFRQQDHLVEGNYVYDSVEGYLQDNWKMTSRFTLDAGMRFTRHGPQYDTKQQSSNFFPDKWSKSSAPLLYIPGCSVNVSPCPAASRVAVNPATGVAQGVGSSVAIGTIVPGTGVIANGIIQAGNGIAKENYVEPALAFGPRVGFAYDLTGSQQMMLRGSVGMFYDRLQGDSVFNQIGNPPNGKGSTVYNSTLQTVASTTSLSQPPPAVTIYYYDSDIPAAVGWNVGLQMALPWSSSLDVSYVGDHNYNSAAFGTIGTPNGSLPMDLNAPDIGTAYLPQYQDPTAAASTVPGAAALPTDLLRPYPGLGAIITTWPRFHSQYDSIQTTYARRFHNGWQAGLNWTLGLRNTGNILSPLHLQHNADGTIGLRPEQDAVDGVLSDVGLRRHVIKANFLWMLPGMHASSGLGNVVAAAVNDWQLSGVLTGGSGQPYDVTYSYQANGANVNLTGSPSYQARIRTVGDIGTGCSSDQYSQFNASSFAGPTYNSIGNESGTNLLHGCADHTLDLSIARNIKLGGSRYAQFRIDLFNVLNTVVINARNATIQYNTPADPTTIRNNQYNADGTLNAARVTPQTAGAGAATAAQPLRSAQVQLRFAF